MLFNRLMVLFPAWWMANSAEWNQLTGNHLFFNIENMVGLHHGYLHRCISNDAGFRVFEEEI